MKWQCSSFEFDSRMPIVMGILNVTPDSFSDGGLYDSSENALVHARQMVADGAEIIDVGGESTRPGAAPVSVEEECRRVLEVVRTLASEGICVSIDTRHALVARECVAAGASIINDVSGFRDPEMLQLAAETNAGLVVMHMQGNPQTMQADPHYLDVVAEVADYLRLQALALEKAGVDRARIAIDPGPGFGKTYSQTVELVRNFQEFVRVGYPVVTAVSRKKYIGQAYKIEDPFARDEASAEETLLACELGASILRIHNVSCLKRTLQQLRPYVLLGLGSNVALVAHPGEEQEGKIAQINHAIGQLCLLPDSQIIDISSFYESEPAYYADQEAFVNAVVLLRTGLSPQDLLGKCQAIEASLGRNRTIENGPRTCDIDILDFQGMVCETETLTLPHPRIQERDFVVKPLLEISPNHVLANDTLVSLDQAKLGAAQRIG